MGEARPWREPGLGDRSRRREGPTPELRDAEADVGANRVLGAGAYNADDRIADANADGG